MTRSFSSVAKWVLCIVLIALFIATFACCFLFSSGTSVASAYSVTLPDDGIVGENLLSSSYFTSYKTSSSWNYVAPFSSSDVVQSSDYCTFSSSASSPSGLFYQDIYYDGQLPVTISFYGRVNSGTISLRLYFGDNFSSLVQTSSINAVNNSEFDVYSFTIRSSDYPSLPPFESTSFRFMISTLYNSGASFDIQWLKVESGSSFTGYIPQTTTSDDYQQGYDDGYKQGTADGVISANSIFVCSRYQVKFTYDTSLNSMVNYLQSYSSDSDGGLPFVCMLMSYIPLSCLVYNEQADCLLPKDLTNSYDPTHPDVSYLDSKYLVHFDSFLELGQWLLDNPDDYLCTQYYTQENVFDALVFLDLSKLSSFMNGSGQSYQVGYDDGYGVGQSDGQKTGYNQGYNAGYSKGAASASDYTFLGLIGAVFDAPIEAFRGLLDFEILGVNMSSFVMAMFSLCIVFLFLKLVLR